MEREYEDKRWQALFEAIQATERAAFVRAGTIAAMTINVHLGKDATPLTAEDIFPFLAKKDGEDAPAEMTTAQTVEHLRAGFSLFVPTAFRQRVGLPDS